VYGSAFKEVENPNTLTPAEDIIDTTWYESTPEPIGAKINFVEGYRGQRFDVYLRGDFVLEGIWHKKGVALRAREAFVEGKLKTGVRLSSGKEIYLADFEFKYLFTRTEEEDNMGAELYGYPPEENTNNEGLEMERKIAELERKNEELRKQKVSEEYGVVEKNHLWMVTILVPARTKFMPKGFGNSPTEKSTEVVTEGPSAIEAAMVAEGMAKGISEDAVVIGVTYQRVLGAIK
ncbi:MAG: hypothetical protein LC650_03475, partial [Actinobacteria bacterium]|nr:hypothetical protein [Actinomycetota bacterium]